MDIHSLPQSASVSLIKRQGLSLNLELTDLARLGPASSNDPPVSVLTSAWVTDRCFCTCLLCECWGSKLRFLFFRAGTFTSELSL